MRWTLVLAAAAWAASGAGAAVVVVGNATGQVVRFVVVPHPEGTPTQTALNPGESQAFTVGRQAELAYGKGGKTDRFRLEPYSAYVFAEVDKAVTVQGIELAGLMPKADDVPGKVDPPKPIRLTVKLLVDDIDPRKQEAWEKTLRQRLTAASEWTERLCGVGFDVTATGEWKSDPAAETLKGLLADFEKKVRPGPARVAVGYTNQPIQTEKDGNVGGTRGPLHTHVLLREGHPRTEVERVEILVHEMCHVLGAAHSPDRLSVVRPKLGDGLAARAKYRIGIDPLNLLAMNIWAEELRGGKLNGWADLSPKARDRLRVIYQTIRHAIPDDPVATEYVAVLERLAGVAADLPTAPPKPADPPSGPLTPKQAAVRAVVRAIIDRASDVGRRPADQRPKGDDLTAEYVRAAASAAMGLDAEVRASAFLLGLGIGLDDSTVLRGNLLTRDLCRAVESDGEWKDRVDRLGVPTVRHRRDLCQHFAVSAALAGEFGPAAAEAAGLAKELLDKDRASGFSFADLAADLAGVAFAERVKKDPELLKKLQAGFKVDEHVPPVTGLPEGISAKRFEADYGSSADPRFKAAVEEVRKKVAELSK